MKTHQATVWWKQPWPWIIIGMLSTTVVASLVTVYIAASTHDSLVVDDYTKQGKAINQRLERDREAERLGIVITPTLEFLEGDLIRIRLAYKAADSQAIAPEFLRLTLSHPTLANQDVSLSLVQVGPGLYQAQVAGLPAGRYYSFTEDPHAKWRVKSRLEVQRP